MTPATRTLDRTLCGLLGLLLAAAGAAAIAWHYQRLAPTVAQLFSAPALRTAAAASWWPWALGAAALVLVAAGLRWLIGHLPRPTHAQTDLSGSNVTGALRLDVDSAGNTAADVLAGHDAIASAKATARRERGHDIIAVTATTTPADLTAAARHAAHVHAQLAAVLDGTPTRARTLIHLTNRRNNRNRVR